MRRTQVGSSMIASIGYNMQRRIMEVEFVSNDAIYQYYNVPPMVYDQVVRAESVGRAFNEYIKSAPDLYPYEQVG